MGDQLKPLRLVSCSNLSNVVDETSNCINDRGPVGSLKISLLQYTGIGSPLIDANAPLTSICMVDSGAANGISDTNLKYPFGVVGGVQLATAITFYGDSTCGTQIEKKLYLKGLIDPPDPADSLSFFDTSVATFFYRLQTGAPPNGLLAGMKKTTSIDSLASTSYAITARTGKRFLPQTLNSTSFKFELNGNISPTDKPNKLGNNNLQFIFK